MGQAWSRRRVLGTTAGALAGLGVIRPGLGLGGPRPASSTEEKGGGKLSSLPPRVVGLRTSGGNFQFDPVGLRIEPGTDLIWLNMGDFHTTTAFHPDNGHLLGGEVPLRIPEGAEPWHSGMLGLTDGTQFEHAFTVEGVYDYFCQPHYGFGMVGRIIVGAARGGPAPVAHPLSELPQVVQSTMPSVEAIMGPAGRAFEWSARLNGVLYLVANGEEAVPSARRALAGMGGDVALQKLMGVGNQQRTVAVAMGAFVEGVEAAVSYEDLVTRSDAVKTELAALTGLA